MSITKSGFACVYCV